MRMSYWSSDVCSSDLDIARLVGQRMAGIIALHRRCGAGDDLVHLHRRVRAARGFVEHGLEHGLAGAIDLRLAFRDRTCVGEVAGRRVQPHELRRHGAAGNVEYRKAGHGYSPFIARISVLMRRSEEHTSELQSLMRTSYADFCL